jgi:hypothetical protein
VTDDGKGISGATWRGLMEEAGISRGQRRLHAIVSLILMVLLAVASALVVVGLFVGGTLPGIGGVLLVATIVLMIATALHRRRLVDKVRWQEGTVAFRTVEPGDVGEDGQLVTCRVTVRPPANISRVATMVGPMDAERLVVGATMRCLIDRMDGLAPLRVFPYARPEAVLPSGRVLKFRKA